ncbi:hypothetical protein Rsub_12590 [Raphidocelis subcapitata]|uniref:Uncharacterized protein n=1 Tax=Raphidocelis subcapitata TaxID=307507 RepID=A0A2V0PGH1_9CHLO|nr:hypothetical protein Rsub_12590 [Raphidocelis subcapitata]|eukprot:GBF98944.1 hypothetical protein Rsub_12590 [Raphidocelis subcapitata]
MPGSSASAGQGSPRDPGAPAPAGQVHQVQQQLNRECHCPPDVGAQLARLQPAEARESSSGAEDARQRRGRAAGLRARRARRGVLARGRALPRLPAAGPLRGVSFDGPSRRCGSD